MSLLFIMLGFCVPTDCITISRNTMDATACRDQCHKLLVSIESNCDVQLLVLDY